MSPVLIVLSTIAAELALSLGIVWTEDMGTSCACGAREDVEIHADGNTVRLNCSLLALGYPYCHGCHDHHRPDVSTRPGDPCPVDMALDLIEAGRSLAGDEITDAAKDWLRSDGGVAQGTRDW